jgi:hypothetical protein
MFFDPCFAVAFALKQRQDVFLRSPVGHQPKLHQSIPRTSGAKNQMMVGMPMVIAAMIQYGWIHGVFTDIS